MPYFRYLKRTYEKASAAWRREQRKNPAPCHICRDPNAEVTPEGVWLCREHKAQLKAIQPYKSYAQRLDDMKIPYLSKEDFDKGLAKPKKKRKLPDPKVKGMQWQGFGKGIAPAKSRTTTPRKKK